MVGLDGVVRAGRGWVAVRCGEMRCGGAGRGG